MYRPSTVVLHVRLLYRRQAIPMEQAKIRPSVTLYTPWTDTKLGTVDYVGDPYSEANFS